MMAGYITVLIGLGFSLTACDRINSIIDPTVYQAEAKVAHDLKDPSSAKFRDIKVYVRSDGTNVCGEVNGKNGFGAYDGFSPFVYTGRDQKAMLKSNDDPWFFATIQAECTTIIATPAGPPPISITVNDRNATGNMADTSSAPTPGNTMTDTTTTTTTNDASETNTPPTPTPTGYTQASSIKFADTSTVSSEASALMRRGMDSDVVTMKDNDGSAVTLKPRLLIPLPAHGSMKPYLIVLTGTSGDCHGCSGVFAVARVEDSGSSALGAHSAKLVQMGAWGAPPQIIVYTKPGAAPLLRASFSATFQGCTSNSGQLYRVDGTDMVPIGKAYSSSACTTD